MSLNFVLFFTAVLAAASALFVRLARRTTGAWLTSVLAVTVAIAAVGWFLFHDVAGYAAAGWFTLFVIVPSRLAWRVQQLLVAQKFPQAQRIARVLAVVHPTRAWRSAHGVIGALELNRQGRTDEAEALFASLGAGDDALARGAKLQLLRMRGDWSEILRITEPAAGSTATAMPDDVLLRIRALGELRRVDEMVAYVAKITTLVASWGAYAFTLRLTLFALSGRREATDRLLDGALAPMPPATKSFWRATAAMRSGDVVAASALLDEATRVAGDDRTASRAIELRRQELAAPTVTLVAPSQASNEILDAIERGAEHDAKYGVVPESQKRDAYATYAIVGLNVVMFVAEVALGGSTDMQTLESLGGLLPPRVTEGDWWRLGTSMFLHFGPVHLAMNLLGLIAFGPRIERSLGRVRYAVVYIGAGLAVGFAHVGLASVWETMQRTMLVGASGCIMGIVGATLTMMLRGWRRDGASAAKRQAIGLVVFMGVQVVFDLTSGNHATIAHATGFFAGAALMALLREQAGGGSPLPTPPASTSHSTGGGGE